MLALNHSLAVKGVVCRHSLDLGLQVIFKLSWNLGKGRLYLLQHGLTCPRAGLCRKMHQGCWAPGTLGAPQPRSRASYQGCQHLCFLSHSRGGPEALLSLRHSEPVFARQSGLGEGGVKQSLPKPRGLVIWLLARQALLQTRVLGVARRGPSTGNEKPW